MILKSAQIKRVFYPESPSGREVTILTDYEEEISRIKRECAEKIESLDTNIPAMRRSDYEQGYGDALDAACAAIMGEAKK
jgi:hypothetical protein